MNANPVNIGERYKYLTKNAIKNISRQRARYMLLGIMIILISSLCYGAFIITVPSKKIIDTYKPHYAPDGYYIKDGASAKDLPVTFSEYLESERIYYLCRKVMFGTVITGTALLLFTASLLINVQIYDTGILYSLGFSRKTIFLMYSLEMILFVFLSITVGIVISAAGVASMNLLSVLPPYFNGSYGIDLWFTASSLILTAALTLTPVLMLYGRLKKTSPLVLLGERK